MVECIMAIARVHGRVFPSFVRLTASGAKINYKTPSSGIELALETTFNDDGTVVVACDLIRFDMSKHQPMLHKTAQHLAQPYVDLATLRLGRAVSLILSHIEWPDGSISEIDKRDSKVEGLTTVLDGLREIALGIHPAILAEGGLGPALKTLAHRSPIPVELDVRTDNRLSEQVEVAAYYVVSEALTNAAKHSQASSVEVEVEVDAPTLRVSVRDDGVGGAHPAGGSGLLGLKDRAEAIGGTVSLVSLEGAGTRLIAELPLDHNTS